MARPNPVGWFEIYVADLKRAQAFYEAVFATKLDVLEAGPELQMLAFPMSADERGCAGALCHMPGAPTGANSTIVYFMSDDCAVEAGRVAGQGGKIFKDKFSIGEHGFIALAFDTENNMFGIHSMK